MDVEVEESVHSNRDSEFNRMMGALNDRSKRSGSEASFVDALNTIT